MSDSVEQKSILVVEDDPIMISFVKKVLQPYGYQVYNVTNGKSCVLALTRYKFDLVIMDINMPIYDGNSATIDIKNHKDLKQTPIIAISSNKDFEEQSKYAGADFFLTKPISKEDLIDKVLELIEKYRST